MSRILRLLREELGEADLRAILATVAVAPIPAGIGMRLRAQLLRAVGLNIGARTLVYSPFKLLGGARASRNLAIGRDCFINAGCVFDATAPIDVGDHVSLGEGVLLTTSSHASGAELRRAGALVCEPVTIGDGAWLASRAVVLPGVTIGAGAIVAAGAVVTRDVAPHSMVGGVPAREVKRLD